jgi:hypothetical protein
MTIQLFNSILTMTTILKLSTDINKILPKKHLFNTAIYSTNYIVEHNKYNTEFRNLNEYHNIKCWKSHCIFDYHIEDENDNNRIFNLDFIINNEDVDNTFIKIDYLEINNDFYNKKFFDYSNLRILLQNDEVKLIRISLINFIENWAIKKNIKKIIIELHSNLERYNEEFKDLGFNIVENKKLLNQYWIEAVKELK